MADNYWAEADYDHERGGAYVMCGEPTNNHVVVGFVPTEDGISVYTCRQYSRKSRPIAPLEVIQEAVGILAAN